MSEEKYNKDSIDCVRKQYPLPMGFEVRPGIFCWGPEGETEGARYLYICLPGGNHMDAIRCVHKDEGRKREWLWDGNEDKPTLTPSLHWTGRWHGHLTNGRLVSC